jgi:hypothetical protein
MGWFKARARKSDPVTSVEAAASVKNITATQERVLFILSTFGPANDEAILAEWNMMGLPVISASGLRSRRKELVYVGLVEDSGARIKMASGRNSIVWQVKKGK